MPMTRRDVLRQGAALLPAMAAMPAFADDRKAALGLVIHSFPVRGSDKAFADPVRFLTYCQGLGAGGVQVGIGARDDAYADDLRARAEAASMYLEGIVTLPRDEPDVSRFEAAIR